MLLKEKKEIEKWLNKYNVKYYELIEDDKYGYVVNVNDNVNLFNKKLKSIDIQFNIINGNFDCSYNKLTNLIGCPEKVEGYFDCRYNKLKSLIGCPEIVNGYFSCSNNNLISLEGCSKNIKDGFYCYKNNLKIDGIINLKFVDVKRNYIYVKNNEGLGELQDIEDFNEVKRILQIYQEKADLMKVLKVTDKSIESTGLVRTVEKVKKI